MRWWVVLALPLSAASAQDAPVGVDPIDPLAQEIAFVTDLTRMTVPVSLAGAGPFRFIVDTGAERTVVSHELARKLRLPPGRVVRLTAMTGTTSVGTVIIPSLSVGALTATGQPRIEAPALSAVDLGALGILGLDTLQGRKVTIDFDTQTMTVTPSIKRRSPPAASDEIVVRARSVFGQLVVTDARYRGQTVRVILDTGSVVSMGNAALRERLARADRKRDKPIELVSVTGETLQAGYTQIGRVSLGDIVFDNLPVAFADAAPFAKFGLVERPAMLLGMDALRLFRRVDIDFVNREVRLRKPRNMRTAN
ncbi:retroviral-like aspartic protease family protein [Sphingomonas sp.]|jgi:predicted aspartyl protease|uniref:retroviral-like aspartic protease family protein n=1 Tax=Sphingomonas sp. TaxID=28214 RepID=UPI002ED9A243